MCHIQPHTALRNSPGVLRTQLSGAELVVYENRANALFPLSAGRCGHAMQQQAAGASLGSLSFLYPLPGKPLLSSAKAALFQRLAEEPEVPGSLSPHWWLLTDDGWWGHMEAELSCLN